MDTCIAIRTMTFKDGVAYLQAGGGIVFDSEEEAEYIETLNKLQGNVRALAAAERKSLDIVLKMFIK
jgi:anthranilate synthase component 1